MCRPRVLLSVLVCLLIAISQPLQAQTETVIYAFCSMPYCADGAYPDSTLIFGADGNLYGVTDGGGAHRRWGTVFALDVSDGLEFPIHSFAAGVNSTPTGGLLLGPKGILYGTDSSWYDRVPSKFNGAVFKLRGGEFTDLYIFYEDDLASGADPSGPLVMDAQGNLYGTAVYGGSNTTCGFQGNSTCGVVFKLTTSGTETVLYNFAGGADGWSPLGGLIFDAQGNLYGTTYYGGGGSGPGCEYEESQIGCGTVFKLTPGGIETVVHSFAGGTDGADANPGLVMDAQGNLYGTTIAGGNASGVCQNYPVGCGTVFKVTPDGTETVLYSFAGGSDGEYPYAGLVIDAEGNLYGTTAFGGLDECYGNDGCGTVFKLTPSGEKTILHSFGESPDGQNPAAGLLFDAQGNLYGTTIYGGNAYAPCGGCGVVFKITF